MISASNVRQGGSVNSASPAFAVVFVARRWSMELWQQLGFKSFGDWRRASERARKAEKKKAAAPASVIASAVAGHGCDVDTAPDPPDDVRVAWQPLRQLDPPSPHRVNSPHAAERLPGNLHEHVEVTPGGSRAHTRKHTSPAKVSGTENRVCGCN